MQSNGVNQRLRRIVARVEEAASECGELYAAKVRAEKEYNEAFDEHSPTWALVNDPRNRQLDEAKADTESFRRKVVVLLAEARSWLAVYAPDGALAGFDALPLNEGYLSKDFLLDLHAFMLRFEPSSTASTTETGSSQVEEGPGVAAGRQAFYFEHYEKPLEDAGKRGAQERFANSAGIVEKTLRNWLEGKRVEPKTRRGLAKAFGVQVEQLPR